MTTAVERERLRRRIAAYAPTLDLHSLRIVAEGWDSRWSSSTIREFFAFHAMLDMGFHQRLHLYRPRMWLTPALPSGSRQLHTGFGAAESIARVHRRPHYVKLKH